MDRLSFAADTRLPPHRFLWQELRIGVPLCVGVAVFLSLLFGAPLLHNLVYSLCIGLSIQALIEGGRYLLAAWLRRHRPGDPKARAGWPGWPLMLPWTAVCALAGYAFGSALAGRILGASAARNDAAHDSRALAVVLMITVAVSVVATWMLWARGRMAAAEAQAEAARRSATESQLRLLQSQLEPHMLFNTLANLRVLIGADPARARDMLDRLIAFLRASLNASRADSHPLSAEFDRIADYLALMQVRMGSRLAVRLDLPEDLRDLRVPPLLLQPLVENALAHGLEPKVEGGRIEVRARRSGDRLELSVRDTGVGPNDASPSRGGGFGLAQVRERLATLHGPRAHLRVEAAGDPEGGTLARIDLPMTPSGPP